MKTRLRRLQDDDVAECESVQALDERAGFRQHSCRAIMDELGRCERKPALRARHEWAGASFSFARRMAIVEADAGERRVLERPRDRRAPAADRALAAHRQAPVGRADTTSCSQRPSFDAAQGVEPAANRSPGGCAEFEKARARSVRRCRPRDPWPRRRAPPRSAWIERETSALRRRELGRLALLELRDGALDLGSAPAP